MPALSTVHSAFCTCASAYYQAVTGGAALLLPAALASPCAYPLALVVHSACWICLLAQVTTAVRGLVRLSCYLLC